MKVTGMNSAQLAGTLYDSSYAGNQKVDDENSLASLLTNNMTANNPAMAKLAAKAQQQDFYKKALSAADSSQDLLQRLQDQKAGLFEKIKDASDEVSEEKYISEAKAAIMDYVSAYNRLITNLSEAGGKTNKNFLSDLNQLYGENQDELGALGITKLEDGTLDLDMFTLELANAEDLEAAFGAASDYGAKSSDFMQKISEKTASTVDSLMIYSAAYSNSGSYSQYDYLKGIYDLKA